MKENKGLSDKQLIEKYEAGEIDLQKTLQKSLEKFIPPKKPIPKIPSKNI